MRGTVVGRRGASSTVKPSMAGTRLSRAACRFVRSSESPSTIDRPLSELGRAGSLVASFGMLLLLPVIVLGSGERKFDWKNAMLIPRLVLIYACLVVRWSALFLRTVYYLLLARGLGIFIQMGNEGNCSQLCISAVSPPVTSAILAEAFSLMLATQIARLLQLQQATFLTDSATLAKAAAARNPILAPGHWTIRPQLAYIAASSAFNPSKIYHIPRNYNFRAHHQAKLALKLQNRTFSFRCLASASMLM